MSNIFNNWCPEIYRSVYIDRHNDDYVKVAPCCQATPQLEPTHTFDFHTSPYLGQLRNEFNQGLQPKACDMCWIVERHGHKSRRHSAIEFYKDTVTDNTIQLQCIDHSATWACNLACIMCGSISSSFWASQDNLDKNDLIKLGRMFQKSNDILKNIDLTHVKKIHFNGGEPMLNNDQTDLLLRLEEQNVLQNVFISYNTNGTTMPSKKIIDLWSKAKLVKIFFSIDAVESAFEYIRWPAAWAQVEKNITEMKQNLPSNVMFGLNCAVGAYNLLEIDKVYSWYTKTIKTNREGDESDFCWQLVKSFPVSVLSKTIKSLAIQRLGAINEFSGLVNLLESTIDCPEDKTWLTKLDTLDIKRNTDWKRSLEICNFIEVENC